MKKFLPLLLFLLPLFSNAQNSFEKYYEGLPYGNKLIKNLEDSSIFILGSTQYISLIKMNQAGTVNSFKCLVPRDTSIHPYQFQITATSDGNYVVGFAYNPKNTALIKIDTSGNILWSKAYENIQLAYSLSETSDRGFVMAGFRQFSFIGGIPYDKIILKTDSLGNIMWDNLIPEAAIETGYEFKLIQSDDGCYLLQNCNSSIKLDSSGNVLRSFDRQSASSIYDLKKIIQINPNKYLAIGSNLRCVDSTGAILWEANSQNQLIYDDVFKINDTTIQLMGPEFSIWQGIFTEKIDDSGNVIQHTTFNSYMQTFSSTFSPALDGGLIICGSVDAYQVQYYSLFVIKTDSNGTPYCSSSLSSNPLNFISDIYNVSNPTFIPGDANMIASPTFLDSTMTFGSEVNYCAGSNSIKETSSETLKVSISPNPNNGSFNLEFSNLIVDGDFTISNNLGQVISSGKLTGVSRLNLEIFGTSGMYFLSIRNGEERLNLLLVKQ